MIIQRMKGESGSTAEKLTEIKEWTDEMKRIISGEYSVKIES